MLANLEHAFGSPMSSSYRIQIQQHGGQHGEDLLLRVATSKTTVGAARYEAQKFFKYPPMDRTPWQLFVGAQMMEPDSALVSQFLPYDRRKTKVVYRAPPAPAPAPLSASSPQLSVVTPPPPAQPPALYRQASSPPPPAALMAAALSSPSVSLDGLDHSQFHRAHSMPAVPSSSRAASPPPLTSARSRASFLSVTGTPLAAYPSISAAGSLFALAPLPTAAADADSTALLDVAALPSIALPDVSDDVASFARAILAQYERRAADDAQTKADAARHAEYLTSKILQIAERQQRSASPPPAYSTPRPAPSLSSPLGVAPPTPDVFDPSVLADPRNERIFLQLLGADLSPEAIGCGLEIYGPNADSVAQFARLFHKLQGDGAVRHPAAFVKLALRRANGNEQTAVATLNALHLIAVSEPTASPADVVQAFDYSQDPERCLRFIRGRRSIMNMGFSPDVAAASLIGNDFDVDRAVSALIQ